MVATKPLRLLIQGGTGNQLMQVTLARFASEITGRKLVVYRTLLDSTLRAARGVTERYLTTIISSLSIIDQAPFHGWIYARLTRRLNIFNFLTICDNDIIEFGVSGAIENKSDAEFIISHATTPELFSPRFNKMWQDIYHELPRAESLDGLGVHLRRGDYLNPDSGFMPLPLDYYKRAIKRVFEELPELGRRVVLFSDDPQWGRVYLNDPSWELQIAIGTAEEDLAAMAGMEALVISNSSFSAVAAHLGESFGTLKVVICPDQWLSDPNRKALGDLRKHSWISLPIQA